MKKLVSAESVAVHTGDTSLDRDGLILHPTLDFKIGTQTEMIINVEEELHPKATSR